MTVTMMQSVAAKLLQGPRRQSIWTQLNCESDLVQASDEPGCDIFLYPSGICQLNVFALYLRRARFSTAPLLILKRSEQRRLTMSRHSRLSVATMERHRARRNAAGFTLTLEAPATPSSTHPRALTIGPLCLRWPGFEMA